MSAGAIAGIVIACVVVVFGIIALVIFLIKRNKTSLLDAEEKSPAYKTIQNNMRLAHKSSLHALPHTKKVSLTHNANKQQKEQMHDQETQEIHTF